MEKHRPLTVNEVKALPINTDLYIVALSKGVFEGYLRKIVLPNGGFASATDKQLNCDLPYDTYGVDWEAYLNREQYEGSDNITLDEAVELYLQLEGNSLPCELGVFDDYMKKYEPNWCKEHISHCDENHCCIKKLITEIINVKRRKDNANS